jgi:tetratricopeptide repeat protein
VLRKMPRLRALPTFFTAVGSILAAGALVAITAMTAAAAVPPNLGKAIEVQKRLTTDHPQDAAAWNDLGNLLVLAHQPTEAEAAYRHATELDPQRVSALFNLGLLRQQRGDVRESKQLFEKVLQAEPQHAWAHYQLGTIFEGKGDKSRAIRQYADAFALDPQLAFREVNPQIVDNTLVTQSMLRAYQHYSSAGEAPAIYDDPSRIRDLLMPKPPKEPVEAQATDQPLTKHPAVLRPKDLPTGNLGQASPPGTKSGTPVTPPPPNPRYAPTYQGSNGTAPQPTRSWPRPLNPANPDGTQPGAVVTPPPTGIYYQPATSSTGRLGSQVMSEENG